MLLWQSWVVVSQELCSPLKLKIFALLAFTEKAFLLWKKLCIHFIFLSFIKDKKMKMVLNEHVIFSIEMTNGFLIFGSVLLHKNHFYILQIFW